MAIPSGDQTFSMLDIQNEFGGAFAIGIDEYFAGGAYVPAGTLGYPGGVATPIPSSQPISMRNFELARMPVAQNYRLTGVANIGEGTNFSATLYVDYGRNSTYNWIVYQIIGGGLYDSSTDITPKAGTVTVGNYTNAAPYNIAGSFTVNTIADVKTEGTEYFRVVVYRGAVTYATADFAVYDTSQEPPPSGGSFGWSGTYDVGADSIYSFAMLTYTADTVDENGVITNSQYFYTYGLGYPLIQNSKWFGQLGATVYGGAGGTVGIKVPKYYTSQANNYSLGPTWTISNPSSYTAVFQINVRFFFETHGDAMGFIFDAATAGELARTSYLGFNQNTGGGSLGGWDGYGRWYTNLYVNVTLQPYSNRSFYSGMMYWQNGDYHYYHGSQGGVYDGASGFRYAIWTLQSYS